MWYLENARALGTVADGSAWSKLPGCEGENDSIAAKRNPKKLKQALEGLPTGSKAYNDAYEGAMRRIRS